MNRGWQLLGMVLVTSVIGSAVESADWPAFRGPEGNGISAERELPLTWGPDENVVWKFPLPEPGNSSPIVSGGRVFVTCATDEGRQRHLYCLDRKSGEELWVRTVPYSEKEPTHQTNPHCASTPLADGERVVVWHGSAGVFCYDFTGEELWSRDLGPFHHIWGNASSPILYGGKVILNCGPGERQFLIALDLDTGETVWKTDEPGGDSGEQSSDGGRARWIGSWSTPVVARVEGEDQILCSMPTRMVAYNPADGEILWYCEGLANLPRGNLVYTSPLIGEGVGVALGGYNGPGVGFKLGGSGDVTEKNQLWRHGERNPQRIGSGVVVGGQAYLANAGPGTVQCLDLESGEYLWEERLPGGNVWGSVVLADGRLYVTNQQGTTHVFLPNPEKFELVASNSLNEPSNSTPAVSEGQIFLRTFQHLYCIGK